jgi:hypothetical protein
MQLRNKGKAAGPHLRERSACGKRAGRVHACVRARARTRVCCVGACVCARADVREGRAHSRKRCRAAVSAATSGLDSDHRTIRCCWAASSLRTASAANTPGGGSTRNGSGATSACSVVPQSTTLA